MIFGAAAGLFAVYYIAMGVFINPVRKAKEDYAKYTNELKKTKEIIAGEMDIASEWKRYVDRTFSFDEPEAYNWFGQALKRTAAEFGFDAPDIKKLAKRDELGRKSGIYVITYQVTIRANYAKGLDFMRGLYEQPFVSTISDVAIVPDPREGRDVVKLTFDVSTPVFPKVKQKDSYLLAGVKETMPRDPDVPLAPWRADLMSDEAFALLEQRNIMRGFAPAPTNQIVVDNNDRKLVALNVTFTWDDRVETELQKGVPPGKQETITGKGDVAELRGVYADGAEFTQRHEFKDGKPWAYKVPSHTPAEAPKVINLAVDNRDDKEVRFDVTIVGEDGKTKTLPTMVIGAGSKIPLGETEAKEMRVIATYSPGKTHPQQIFKPGANEQVYLIPLEPIEQEPTKVVVVDDEPIGDLPPDGSFTVKGLLTYRDVQEMIVEDDGGDRKIIRAGVPGEVDGGMLFAVCPLGGIVHMPETNHFYLYPRGESFDRRVKLEATKTEQLASAIYAWSQQ